MTDLKTKLDNVEIGKSSLITTIGLLTLNESSQVSTELDTHISNSGVGSNVKVRVNNKSNKKVSSLLNEDNQFDESTIAKKSRKNKKTPPEVISNDSHNKEEHVGDNPTKNLAFIVGDSLVQHLQGWKLSNSDLIVSVKSFAGSRTEDMEDYL